MLLMGRTFSADLANPNLRERTTVTSTQWGAAASTWSSGESMATWGGRVATTQGGGIAAGSSTTVTTSVDSVRQVDPQQGRLGLGGPDAASFEAGFTQAFTRAGVRLVDRGVAMRMASRNAADANPNPQAVEAEAVARSADLLLEIVAQSVGLDGSLVFAVSVREARTGHTVLAFQSTAEPPAPVGMPEYVAVPGQGFRPRDTTPTFSDRGAALASETMDRLAGAWRGR
jgi:hypothetical protein